jgi:site-specific recombinase XerC
MNEKDAVFSSHGFRKRQITKLWQDSGDIQEIKLFIGHTNVTTTAGYIATEVVEETAEKINKRYGELGSDLNTSNEKDN